jgi:PAS domain S-box-containing protein
MWILGKDEITERDADGNPVRFTGLHIDISQQKRVEEKEHDFSMSLIDAAQIIVLVLDADARIVQINPYAEVISGYNQAEVKGQDWCDIFLPEEHRSNIRAILKKAIANTEVRGQINPILTKDGRELQIEWNNKTLKDPNGTVTGLLCIGHDITERQQAAKALQRSEERFRVLIEQAPEAITVYDIDLDCFVDCNIKATELFGYSREEFLAGGKNRLYPSNQPDGLPISESIADHNRRALAGETVLFERTVQKSNGQKISCEVRLVQLPCNDRRLMRASFLDITDRKRAEAEREEMETQLRQKHKMEAVGYMAGGMAHNFNNNLGIILGNVELAQLKQPRNSDVIPLLENAKIAVGRSRDLVRKIITYSRQGIQQKAPMRLTTIADETISLLKSTLPATVALQKGYSPDCNETLINADASQIQEVLINLCNNAIQAMQEKGELKIQLKPVELTQKEIPAQYDCLPGRYAKLSVQDSGCGMPAEMLDKIFDPFYTTKEAYEGAGMGLATVQGIVAQHGGIIKVNSVPDQGTVFNLYFPIIEQTYIDESEEENTTLPRGTERILFVDDDEMLASLGEKLLIEMGYQVTVMNESTEALKMFAVNAEHFDLVFTDQTMPQLSGKDLIKELKKIKPDIPTILCTGYSSKIDEDHAKELGINAFMMKPLDLIKLAQTVRRVLDGVEIE